MFKTDQQRLMYAPIAQWLNEALPGEQQRDINSADESQLPNTSVLNQGFNAVNTNNQTLHFVTQNEDLPHAQLAYEERIFLHGIIATRNNWHDYFNALVWKRFPHIKSALNAIHHQEMIKQSGSQRSRKRDLLTLFDECGVIIIADQPVLDMIKNHQWQELFVENKELWLTGEIQVITFGHAMFEKYIQPYIGMTAQALLFSSEQFNTNKITDIDDHIGQCLVNNTLLQSKAELSPLPILGIPDWHDDQDQQFYANTQYFRPKRPS